VLVVLAVLVKIPPLEGEGLHAMLSGKKKKKRARSKSAVAWRSGQHGWTSLAACSALRASVKVIDRLNNPA